MRRVVGYGFTTCIETIVRLRMVSVVPWHWLRRKLAEHVFRSWEHVPMTCVEFDGICVVMRGRHGDYVSLLQGCEWWMEEEVSDDGR